MNSHIPQLKLLSRSISMGFFLVLKKAHNLRDRNPPILLNCTSLHIQSPIKYLQFNWITEKTQHYQTAERIFWKLMLTSKLNTLVRLFAIFCQTGEYFAVTSPFPVNKCKFYIYRSAIELWGIFIVTHPLWHGTYILMFFPSVLQFSCHYLFSWLLNVSAGIQLLKLLHATQTTCI